jgi:oxygen-dependent protoporphyrinogen oxidase
MARRAPEGDESVFEFAKRRIGEQPARLLVDAMVAGVYAGDSRALSLRSAFPVMAEMEREHGSLLRAMQARAKSGKGSGGGPFGPGGTLRSFDGGMQVLTDALRAALGACVRTGKRAMGLRREGDDWVVQSSDGEHHRADAVVIAAPAPDAAMLLGALDGRFREPLFGIPLAPVTVVTLRYAAADAEKAALGFGFLVPAGERLRVLGVLFESTVFPGRAVEGEVLLRVMVGGARNPDLAAEPDDTILQIVREDLKVSMSIEAEPKEARIHRHLQGIPQYTVGHADRLAALEIVRVQHPTLHLTGNSYRGVAMNHCIRDALQTAKAVLGKP